MSTVRLASAIFSLALAAAACSKEPAAAPDPPRVLRTGGIVFGGNCGDGFNIYNVAADGSGRHSLTAQPGIYMEPVWSPDGSAIAHLSVSDAGYFVAVMNADGTNRRAVTTPYLDRNPTWSPDGRRIAFESRRIINSIGIGIVNVDGTEMRELTGLLPGFAMDPDWSPDGRSIAYQTARPQGGQAIGTTGIDGQNSRYVTSPPALASDYYPAWSPDGRRIAFARFWSGDSSALHLIDADGRNEQRLTHFSPGFDLMSAWSPDGRQIVFSHSPDNSGPLLWVVNADGTGAHQITTGSCQELHPSW